MTCLPGALCLERLGRSSGKGWGMWQGWVQERGRQTCTLILRSFSVPPGVVHISKIQKESAGSTGKCVLSHLWKWDLAAPWGAGPWMPEQDHCPASAWGPSLSCVFPPCPLLSLFQSSHASWSLCACHHCSPSLSHHALCAVPITSPPLCPHGMPTMLCHPMPIALSQSHAHHAAPPLPIPFPSSPPPLCK